MRTTWSLLAVFFLSYIWTGHANKPSLCLRELQGRKGIFYFPDLIESEKYNNPFYTTGEDVKKDCVFYMDTHGSTSAVLIFSNLKLGRAELKMKKLLEEDGKQTWGVFHSLSGNIQSSVVVRAEKVKSLKLVVPKNAGSFTMEYELITCSPPEPMMQTLACTKDYFADTHCIFQCSDDFYPALLSEPRLHAHCTRSLLSIISGSDHYEWGTSGPDFENACIDKTTVEEDCFKELKSGETDKCPYSFDDVLRLLGEDFEVPEEDGEPIQGQKGFGGPQPPSGPSDRFTMGVRKPVHPKCKRHCQRKFSSGKYTPSCGSLKRSKAKRTCVACRYGQRKLCAGSSLLVG